MPGLIQIQWILMLFVNGFADRLPNNLIPIEYKLEIVTNLDGRLLNFDFKGSVLIHIKCVSSTDTIVLHSKDLNITEENAILKALNETADTPTIIEISQNTEHDFLILKLSQILQPDHHYEVKLDFEAELRQQKVGYYRTFYWTSSHKKKWLAVTYFKPNNARKAFPCFDELTFKAKFTISLGMPMTSTSVSNMPVMRSLPMDGRRSWKWNHFESTPPMSTCNVVFAIVTLPSERINHDRLTVTSTIYSRPEVYEAIDYVVRFSRQFLYIFETVLDMKYPLPKLDIIAIPNYGVPVMESWGVIIWQEEYLIQITTVLMEFNPEIFGVVANQMVRQWFGNLVTVKSWTDAWFMDGLSRYLSEIAVDNNIFPDLDWLSYEISANVISVLDFDSLKIAQAVSTDDSSALWAIPCSRAHRKAFLLFRMFSHFIGHKNLREIVNHYLKMYKYENAGSEELLDLATKNYPFRNIYVKAAMNTWVMQAGFPLITVTRNYKRGTIEVKQERFSRNSELIGNDSAKWWIPLTYTTECEFDFNNTLTRKWLTPNDESIIIETTLSGADWVIFNIDASGLYLVDYDRENWNLIIDYLHKPFFERIPPISRAMLISNAANLAWVGRMHYKIFFDMIKYIVQERDVHPIYAAIFYFDALNTLLKRTPIHRRFVNYVRRLYPSRQSNISRSVGENRVASDPRGDAQDISAACKFEPQDCVEGPLYRSHQRSGFGHIFAAVTSNGYELTQIIIEVARCIMTDSELLWLKNLTEANPFYFLNFESGVEEALELAKVNVQWHHKHYITFEAYFDQNYDY